MSTRSINTLCLIFALLALPLSGAAVAADRTPGSANRAVDPAEAKAKLAEVRRRIAALTVRLRGETQARDALDGRLREADLEITGVRRRLDSLHATRAAALERRAQLRAEEGRVQRALVGARSALAAQVRAAYEMGRQEELRLLLSQSDPAAAGRMAVYYGYFARARAAQIAEIANRVNRLQELGVAEDETNANLRALELDANREVADLKRARQARAAALAAASHRVDSGKDELARLRHEEQAEESLVTELAQLLQDFPIDDAQQSFAALRGRLPWPVVGRLTARFQEARAGVRSRGVLIEAAGGAKVRAAFFGRVVYADWLPGLGLLLIIGHQGNYMTLYGHVEVLYKSVGDWVAPGDVVAALGDAGGARPQLYFEIRDGRTPQDPKIWLKSAP